VKAWGRLFAAAGAVLIVLAMAAGASGAPRAHRRHVQVTHPEAAANLLLGRHGGYQLGILFEEPDLAVLVVHRFDKSTLGVEETTYGAHFHGSLLGGRVTANFGAVGSISARFRPGAGAHDVRLPKRCEGKAPRREPGRWVGGASLRGEGGYFAVATGSAKGERIHSFLTRCRVKHPSPPSRRPSLRERVEPQLGFGLGALLLGTASSLQAVDREPGRQVEVLAAHATGTGPGAEVEAGAFEYQGRMPVGRFVQITGAPPGSLVTTLPGEHPASATLKPGAPFSGEARYLGTSPTTHSWTGTLAVRFPGLEVPLVGKGFYTSLCVISPLIKPQGCEFQTPSLQGGGESTTAGGGR
jgi:hypothetical protein